MVDSAANRPRILIADDEEKLREALVNMLAIHGFQVVGVAASGTEAIALATAAHPDLVLLDYSMPGMNGVKAMEAIKEVSPNAQVVIFTVHSETSLSLDVTSAGAFAFLVKGCPPSLILEVLNRAWERKQAIDQGERRAG